MRFLTFLKANDARSLRAQKNILGLFFNKVLAMIISFQLIPATIGYIDSSQYGIWITISSLATWMLYFDFGLTHGFRNGFAVALAHDNIKLAKEYVSTTYLLLIIIFFVLLVIGLLLNNWIDWSVILGVEPSLSSTLHNVFMILMIFLSIQMIGNIFTTMLLAIQKPAISSFLGTLGQSIALCLVYTLTYTTEGSLEYLSVVLIGVPALMLLAVSVYFFRFTMKDFAPSILSVNFSLSKDILGLGSKFFIIQIAMLFVFQFANFILIRIMGADSVTSYNISYRYFSIIYIVMGIVYMPFWTAFTEAYAKKEYNWMTKTYNKLSKIWYSTFFVFAILVLMSSFVYEKWLAKGLDIDMKLSIIMGVSMIIQSRANLYMFCLNGIGKVRLQMIVYVLFAFVSAPLMYMLTLEFGYYGILIVTSCIYLCQAVVGHIQLTKILRNEDKGLWSR